jgi:hypothetical protein
MNELPTEALSVPACPECNRGISGMFCRPNLRQLPASPAGTPSRTRAVSPNSISLDHRWGALDKVGGLWYSRAHVPLWSTPGRVIGPTTTNATPWLGPIADESSAACYPFCVCPVSSVPMGKEQSNGVSLYQSRYRSFIWSRAINQRRCISHNNHSDRPTRMRSFTYRLSDGCTRREGAKDE